MQVPAGEFTRDCCFEGKSDMKINIPQNYLSALLSGCSEVVLNLKSPRKMSRAAGDISSFFQDTVALQKPQEGQVRRFQKQIMVQIFHCTLH